MRLKVTVDTISKYDRLYALEKEVEQKNPIEKNLTKKKVKLCNVGIKAPSEHNNSS